MAVEAATEVSREIVPSHQPRKIIAGIIDHSGPKLPDAQVPAPGIRKTGKAISSDGS